METMTKDKTTESMPGSMKNAFFGEISKEEKDDMQLNLIKGLIKNHRILLEEALTDAKLKFADVSLEKENWSGKYEREMQCNVIKGQLKILNEVLKDIENMLSPYTSQVPSMPAQIG